MKELYSYAVNVNDGLNGSDESSHHTFIFPHRLIQCSLLVLLGIWKVTSLCRWCGSQNRRDEMLNF